MDIQLNDCIPYFYAFRSHYQRHDFATYHETSYIREKELFIQSIAR